MPKGNDIYKNFMPSEGGIWKETANDEHLPTFLARYEIKHQETTNTTMKEIFRVEKCDKYGNHFNSIYFFSNKKYAQQYAKNFTNPNSYIYIQKYILIK